MEDTTILSEDQIIDISEVENYSLENTKSSFETTKITDLNVDCMELVFKHLEFNDLVNISDSSKQFNSAVCRVYKNKYMDINPIFDRSDYQT